MSKMRQFSLTSLTAVLVLFCSGTWAQAVELVRDGRPVAAIVVPAEALPVESYAARELQYHVEASSGAQLPIVAEGRNLPPGAHVFLGNCNASRTANVDPSALPGNGYVVKTIGNDLFIADAIHEAIRWTATRMKARCSASTISWKAGSR